MYYATICRLKDVRPMPNADRLKLANVCGSQIIVGLEAKDGDLGIFFPSEGRLSVDYCKFNDLIGEKKYFSDKRRVRIQKMRGSFSEGYFASLSSLSYIDSNLKGLEEGMELTEYKGQLICEKYITPQSVKKDNRQTKEPRAKRKHPFFREHFDTSQLIKNIHNIMKDDVVVVTLKMHGTSARVAKLPVSNEYGWFKRTLAKLLGMRLEESRPVILVGTRRVELGDVNGLQDDRAFRRKMALQASRNMRLGETVYSEIVGYDHNYKPIMNVIGKKTLGEDFKHYLNFKQQAMHYKYSNEFGECSQFVYRITQTDENGHVFDLSWAQLKKRCIELELRPVYELMVFMLKDHTHEEILKLAEILAVGSDPIDPSHIREGVVFRIENEFGINCYKHKSKDFRLLEDSVMEEENVEDQS